MQKNAMSHLPLLLLQYLQKETDEDHPAPLADIMSFLEEKGFPVDRRSVYKIIELLNLYGHTVCYRHRRGYWYEPEFTPAEVFYLLNAVGESSVLSDKETGILTGKISGLLSEERIRQMPPVHHNGRSGNENVLTMIDLLLKAIAGRHPVEFLYFDISVSRQKKYRRKKERYHLVPYAIISSSGRFYCIFYSETHRSFANYRLDKMDKLTILEEVCDPVYFSLDDHIRSSFNMYHGDPRTITAVFDISLSSQVFDQFGDNILISKADEKTFTASIRSALTPTLVSWILQFYDRIQILHPDDLIDELNHIADTIHLTYNKENRKEGK